jgi:hypothetical protein
LPQNIVPEHVEEPGLRELLRKILPGDVAVPA